MIGKLQRFPDGGLMQKLRRIWDGKQYLHDRPWYMVIGMEGAGKTSVVRSAELSSVRNVAHQNKIFSCWLSDQAMLIEPSGSLFLQAESKETIQWHHLLCLLRKYRPRTPVNGAIVVLDIATFLQQTDMERQLYAEQLSCRLQEIRTDVGYRFPVYLVISKMDVIEGFTPYFDALTRGERAQAWGFSLPYEKNVYVAEAEKNKLKTELIMQFQLLDEHLQATHEDCLQRTFSKDQRRVLTAFPKEFTSLITPLVELIKKIFDDCNFDPSEHYHSLRGVYFTSTAQQDISIPVDQLHPLQRQSIYDHTIIKGGTESLAGAEQVDDFEDVNAMYRNIAAAHNNYIAKQNKNKFARSYFLADLFRNIIVPEAHLVKPNLRRAYGLWLRRWLGHGAVGALGLWLVSGLALSSSNNNVYLTAIHDKTTKLHQQLQQLFATPGAIQLLQVPDALSHTQALAQHDGVDVSNPPVGFRYGLYTGSQVLDAGDVAYQQLEDRLLLPHIDQRLQTLLTIALHEQDKKINSSKAIYDSLRVYLQLHDKTHFNAEEVKAWVMQDWSATAGAAFGGRTIMQHHLNALFSDERMVQSPLRLNVDLVQQARTFLDNKPANQRLYERTMAAMPEQQDFTIADAIGPQANDVLRLASGKSLTTGVPGIFTYDGYHAVFDQQLAEFAQKAQVDDAWVMGHTTAPDRLTDREKDVLEDSPIVQDIRTQYLQEYRHRWSIFLDDIDTVTGSDLKADIKLVSIFVAADDPLSRLAKIVARETSLSRPLNIKNDSDRSLLDRAGDSINEVNKSSRTLFGISSQMHLERELVDKYFAPLRQVVTAQTDAGRAIPISAGITDMPHINAQLNTYRTQLLISDTALSSNGLPPDSTETREKLIKLANASPAPYKNILITLAANSTQKIANGASTILRLQAQQKLDHINHLMTEQVSKLCLSGIAGRYPFAASINEVAIDDFLRMFAQGGAADTFFQQKLAPFVDTSARPWRYINPDTSAALTTAQASILGVAGSIEASSNSASDTNNHPTLLSEYVKLLAQQGPNLEFFALAKVIREAYFQNPGRKTVAWKTNVSVKSLDPTILTLLMSFDGQAQRYSHGPVQPLTVNWPGLRSGTTLELTAHPRISVATSTIKMTGPWAMLHLMQDGKQIGAVANGKVLVEFDFDMRKAVLEFDGGDVPNPLTTNVLEAFNCQSTSKT